MLSCMTLGYMSCLLLSYMILLSWVQGEDTQKETSSPHISHPMGSQAFHSHCYALLMTPKSWFNADLACQKWLSGYLVSVLSGAEASFLSSLVNSRVNNYQYVWIGLHDPTLNQEPNGAGWERSNSDMLNYFNWDGNSSSALGHCGSLIKTSGVLKWKDCYCDMELPYVCKFKF
ncbi:regenerating islet-derived protein 3-alpha-like [Nannospalax galili]|uniref:regenerating islet-derived protein 3-alpha-like n=1 Tax=Nannospalax galili TaxID=1026970 RepID=UPI0004ED36CE|nr:regenerating islet-derived protein 3-alpha-like [Nannospalax galili]